MTSHPVYTLYKFPLKDKIKKKKQDISRCHETYSTKNNVLICKVLTIQNYFYFYCVLYFLLTL